MDADMDERGSTGSTTIKPLTVHTGQGLEWRVVDSNH